MLFWYPVPTSTIALKTPVQSLSCIFITHCMPLEARDPPHSALHPWRQLLAYSQLGKWWMREWSSEMSKGRGWSVIAYVCCDLGWVTNSIWSSVGNYSEIIVNPCQGMTYFWEGFLYLRSWNNEDLVFWGLFKKIWCRPASWHTGVIHLSCTAHLPPLWCCFWYPC